MRCLALPTIWHLLPGRASPVKGLAQSNSTHYPWAAPPPRDQPAGPVAIPGTSGTKRTGASSLTSSPCAVRTTRISVWAWPGLPTGTTMMPSTASWSSSADGGSTAAAVTLMPVERRLLGPAAHAVAGHGRHVVQAERRKALLGLMQKRAMPLDRVDTPAQARHDGGVVAGSGADLQHLHTLAQVQGLEHAGNDRGLAERLAMADRQRHVLVGLIAERLGHEHLARDALDRRKDAGIRDPALAQREDEADLVRRCRHANACCSRFTAPPWVMSRCTGVTEMLPAATTAKSLPGRGLMLFFSAPIQ